MAATRWRIRGIETFSGTGDLEMSELRLWGKDTALDAGATLSSSLAPVAGNLSNLVDGNPSTTCRWSGSDARAPGFYIEWELPSAVDAWCARMASPARATAVVRYTLEKLEDGVWLADEQGDLVYGGTGLSAAIVSQPVFEVPLGWSRVSGVTSGGYGHYGVAVSADRQTAVVTLGSSSSSRNSISKDGGRTWVQLPMSSPSGFRGVGVSADGQVICIAGYGTASAKMHLSTDGGTTWTQPAGPLAGSRGFWGVGVSANGQTILAVGTGTSAKVNVSTDGGATWSQPAGPVPGYAGYSGAAVSADGQTMIVTPYGSQSGSQSKPYFSKDGGVTWSLAAISMTSAHWYACAVSADGQLLVVVGGLDGYAARPWISKDGGSTWVQATQDGGSSGTRGVSVSADGQKIVMTQFGGSSNYPFISRDGGTTWTTTRGSLPTGLPDTSRYYATAMSADGASVFVTTAETAGAVYMLKERDPTYTAQSIAMRSSRTLSLTGLAPPPQGVLHTGFLSTGQFLDVEFGGKGRIFGTVARKNTPENVPLIRRVRLHRSADGLLARETWSKADGSYEFREINPHYEYDAVAWDHEMTYRTVVANNLVPEV